MPGPLCEFCTSPELRCCFVEAHWICWASFGEIRAAGDDSSISKMNFQERCHFVVASAFSLRVHIEVDPADHLLHIRTLDDSTGELAQSCLSPQKKNRHAKFHAELGFQSCLGPMMKQRRRHL